MRSDPQWAAWSLLDSNQSDRATTSTAAGATVQSVFESQSVENGFLGHLLRTRDAKNGFLTGSERVLHARTGSYRVTVKPQERLHTYFEQVSNSVGAFPAAVAACATHPSWSCYPLQMEGCRPLECI